MLGRPIREITKETTALSLLLYASSRTGFYQDGIYDAKDDDDNDDLKDDYDESKLVPCAEKESVKEVLLSKRWMIWKRTVWNRWI